MERYYSVDRFEIRLLGVDQPSIGHQNVHSCLFHASV